VKAKLVLLAIAIAAAMSLAFVLADGIWPDLR
jgi:hypothetical protein